MASQRSGWCDDHTSCQRPSYGNTDLDDPDLVVGVDQRVSRFFLLCTGIVHDIGRCACRTAAFLASHRANDRDFRLVHFQLDRICPGLCDDRDRAAPFPACKARGRNRRIGSVSLRWILIPAVLSDGERNLITWCKRSGLRPFPAFTRLPPPTRTSLFCMMPLSARTSQLVSNRPLAACRMKVRAVGAVGGHRRATGLPGRWWSGSAASPVHCGDGRRADFDLSPLPSGPCRRGRAGRRGRRAGRGRGRGRSRPAGRARSAGRRSPRWRSRPSRRG